MALTTLLTVTFTYLIKSPHVLVFRKIMSNFYHKKKNSLFLLLCFQCNNIVEFLFMKISYSILDLQLLFSTSNDLRCLTYDINSCISLNKSSIYVMSCLLKNIKVSNMYASLSSYNDNYQLFKKQQNTKCTVTFVTCYQSLTTKQSFINEPFIKEIVIIHDDCFKKTQN